MPKRAVSTRPRGWQVPPLEEAGPDDKVITHSEIEAFRQCQLKWQLGYLERWKIADEDRSDDSPLTKGTLYHAVLEEHYTIIKRFQDEGGSPEVMKDQIAAAVATLLWDQETGKQSELQALVWWMYQGYVAQYGFDQQWEILGVEVKFQARLYDPQGRPTPYLLKGKLDMVVRDRKTGKIWIVDHKSGKDLPNQLELDVADQFTLYAWLLLRAGIEIIGVIHGGNRTTQNLGDKPENQDAEGNPLKSSQKKQTLDQRLRRTLLTRGKRELENVAKDAWAVAVNMYPEYSGLDALPMYTAPDPRQCSWKCDFLDVHLMARKGRSLHTALKEFGFTQQFEERY